MREGEASRAERPPSTSLMEASAMASADGGRGGGRGSGGEEEGGSSSEAIVRERERGETGCVLREREGRRKY